MDILELLGEKEFLGRDFLTWLWFKSESNLGQFTFEDSRQCALWFDDKITLQSEGTEAVQTVICQGENSELTEARHALLDGKKVTLAEIKFILGEDEWSFMLDSTWLNFKSLKTPEVDLETKEDPDGLFYEKIFLLDTVISAVEEVFVGFLRLRISDDWDTTELPAVKKWMQDVKTA